MVDLTVINAPENAKLAQRIRDDLASDGVTIHDTVHPDPKSITVIVFSPEALANDAVQAQLYTALDHHQHIVPVLASAVDLPRLINHLQPLDFSAGYNAKALRETVATLSGPNAPKPLTVLTPNQSRANRRFGLIFAVLALVVFGISVYLIAVEGLRAPEEELFLYETQIVVTIDAALPRSTADAAAFPATVTAVSTRDREGLAATATAIADDVQFSFVPRTTEDANFFPLTAEAVSTLVRGDLIATATAIAPENPTDDE